MNKIDPKLLNVFLLENCEKSVECVVYSNNFLKTKKSLEKFRFIEFPFINAFGLILNKSNILDVAEFNHVNYIASGAKVFAQINVAKEIVDVESLYQQKIFGENITVAVIDTGIYPHLDFIFPKNRIIAFKDFVNGKTYPYDDNGHGTFVAGALCGGGVVNKKYMGVAPKVNVVSLKALNSNGETGALTILEAMQWIFDNRKKYNIKVVCMSFGANPLRTSDPLKRGAERLWNDGIVVVSAGGNSGPEGETIKSPGISPKIITVGALDDHRNENDEFDEKLFSVAEFSSRGPAFSFLKPDCLASGVNIKGLKNSKELFTKMSGTSVSTPIVAGVCALICEKYSGISPNRVKYLLLKNAQTLTKNRLEEGYGIINSNV